MEENLIMQEKIDKFLKENNINITGGKITSEKQLASVLNNLAMSDYKKGKLDKALYFIDKSLEFNGANYYAYFIRGLIYRHQKKTKEAIESFKIYHEKTDDSLTSIYIGLSYAELNDIENGLDFLRKGEKNLSKEDKDQHKLLICAAYECIGNIYLNKENVAEFTDRDKYSINYKSAIKYYKSSLKINRKNCELINRLAACYYHVEEYNKALYCYEQAAKIAPDNSVYLDAIKEMKEAGAESESAGF